ncbi:9328_t:CDS:2 [Entrophospora sp. SA101]|nr:9328_t:CDS:2 [Entrophospora sp. SA101]
MKKDVEKSKKVKKIKKVSGGRGCLNIHSSFNNLIITITKDNGDKLAQISARTATGYRGTKKSTPFAAQKAAEAALAKLTEFGISGRDAVIKKICASPDFQVETLIDKTALAFNGCRPRKTPPIFAVKISDKGKTITNEIANLEGVKEIPIYLIFHLKKLVFQPPQEDFSRQGKVCILQINIDNSQGKEEYVVTGKDVKGELNVLNPETYLATVAPASQLKITLYCRYYYAFQSAKEQKTFFQTNNSDDENNIQIKNENNLIFLDSDYCPVKTYILPEDKEKLLSQVSISRHASAELYDTLTYADRQPVFIDYEGKKQELTLTLYTKIMEKSHPKEDQNFRYEHSFAKIYEGILRTSVEELEIRSYQSTLEIGLIGDNIPKEVYTLLIKIGQKNTRLYRNFLQIKKKAFSLTKFYATDTSLKIIPQYQKQFTVDESIVLIKKVLQALGAEYQKKLNLALQPGRIDYFEDTNKLNTLIHELGHSVHTLFAEENQPYPDANYPIILAEVASTLNEHLLFDYLYQKSQNKEEKIYLLQSRIEEIMGTFFRQIQFAKFE